MMNEVLSVSPAPATSAYVCVSPGPASVVLKVPTADPKVWTLFNHIKRNKIAMTAPVEMTYDSDETSGAPQRSMAFLYGSSNLGEAGTDGSVQVMDVPAQTVISVGVRGSRTTQKVASAQQLLTEWLDVNSTRYQPAGETRVMGYNSPFVPANRKYFEVQIPITDQDS